jgi:NDP-sugar pyrophosphorylase family protein
MPVAAILAGGLATRLNPVTREIPKPLLEVGGHPFIHHQMELLKRKGIREVVICAGHLGEQIRDYLGDGENFGLGARYSFDGEKLLGTGGALRKALPLLGEMFWVIYGDSFLDTDYRVILERFRAGDKLGLMTVFANENRWDTSNVFFTDGEIKKYDKSNPDPNMRYIDYGLSLLRTEAFCDMPEKHPWDLAELLVSLIERNQLMGYEVKERFYEIGSPEGLAETDAYLAGINKRWEGNNHEY